MTHEIPRLVIAGLAGDSGKTVISLSIIRSLVQKGLKVASFKKGPDYIDASWLGEIAQTSCRNLDTYLVDPKTVYNTFLHNSLSLDIAIIEGNRGLFDGRDAEGTNSTANLAKLLDAPVILAINVSKTTRTAAAIIKGCQVFDPELEIKGVILNRVAGDRHKDVLIKSIEKYCKLPVLGALPKFDKNNNIIPNRHLGLITPHEFEKEGLLCKNLLNIANNYLDINSLIDIAQRSKALPVLSGFSAQNKSQPALKKTKRNKPKIKIGYFWDEAFSFYYPENLESLQDNGAQLVTISSFEKRDLGDVDGLYIGGGFPEMQAKKISINKQLLQSVKKFAEKGYPIYAECGGLIYLCRSISWNNIPYSMANVFPLDLIMLPKPAGHGYCRVQVDKPNPFFEEGQKFSGHEFHYSRLAGNEHLDGTKEENKPRSCLTVNKGVGLGVSNLIQGGKIQGQKRDGLIFNNTLACYIHIHAKGVTNWAHNFIESAVKIKLSLYKDGMIKQNFNLT